MRWTITWFGAGLGAYGAGIMWLFPVFKDDLADFEYPEEVLAFFGGGDLSHPAGFLTIEYMAFAPIVLTVYAIIAATGQLAGEEGAGTLDTLLAQPVTRTRIIMEKAIAVLLGGLLICAITCIGWLASIPFLDLDGELTLLETAGATFGMLPVAATFGALGFLAGAIAPSRGQAAGLLVAFAVASYLIVTIAQGVEAISWLRNISAFHYADSSRWLTDGPVWYHQLGLIVVAVVVFTLAVRAFGAREVGSRRWQHAGWLAARRRAAPGDSA